MFAAGFGSWAALAILAWAVASLGATQPWGYIPLLVAMALYGTASVLNRDEPTRIRRGLGFSFLVFCSAVFFQLVPLPHSVVEAISPASGAASQAGPGPRPISIDPRATALGLTFIVALGLFLVGLVRTMQRDGVRRIASGLVGLGTLVALVGIAEVSTSWRGVYAAANLPLPPDSMPHGPFSSRNHYASWMLMAFAVALACFCAIAEQPNRRRLGQLFFTHGAAMTMALALVQTRSRAALLGLTLAVATMYGLLLRRTTARATRMLVTTLAGVLLAVAVTLTGTQAIVSRFAVQSWSTGHGRLPIWQQATTIASDFALTGSGVNTYQRVVRFYPSEHIDQPYEGAHNDYLQLALEGGLLVGLPAMATLGFFILESHRRIRDGSADRMTQWVRIGGVVGLLLVAAHELVDFSLQVPGNAVLFTALAAIAVHQGPHKNA